MQLVDLQIWIPELSLMSDLSQAAQVPENFTLNAKPKNFRLRKAYTIVLFKKIRPHKAYTSAVFKKK